MIISSQHRFLGLILFAGLLANLARGEHKRQDDSALPSTPPWAKPEWLPAPPACLSTPASDCPYTPEKVASCTAEQCYALVFGGCVGTVPMIDKSCLCEGLSWDKSCSSCTEGSGRDLYLYEYWLNGTCGDLSDWNGLPEGWGTGEPATDGSQNLVNVGFAVQPSDRDLDYRLPCDTAPISSETCELIFTESYYMPEVVNQSCSSFFSDVWLGNLYNYTEAQVVDPGYFSALGWQTSSTEQKSVYIDLRMFCSNALEAPGECAEGPERTALLLWAAQLCETRSFNGFPEGWNSNFSSTIMDEGHLNKSDLGGPDCLNPNNCWNEILLTVNGCGGQRCTIDEVTGLCVSISEAIETACLCKYCELPIYPSQFRLVAVLLTISSVVDFAVTCPGNCRLSWERAQYLNWLNETCSLVPSYSGLPTNWSSLLDIQTEELLPWGFRLRIFYNETLLPPNSTSEASCPSVQWKLGAFAVVNAVMALLVPVLGRRDVIKRITFGVMGKAGSGWWVMMGPLTVALHLIANAISATLIKRTPGYGDVDIGRLVLLWCTRPRVSWMVVMLLPFDAKNSIYFSVATSSLLAEALLQALGSYYMGVATDYARRQRFYDKRLQGGTTRGGKDAYTMYVGSVMWLSAVVFAMVALGWSIFNMSERIKRAKKILENAPQKAMKNAAKASKRLNTLTARKTSLQGWEHLMVAGLSEHHVAILNDVQTLAFDGLEKVRSEWEDLATYLQLEEDSNIRPPAKDVSTRNEKENSYFSEIPLRGSTPADDVGRAVEEQRSWQDIPTEKISEFERYGEEVYHVRHRDLSQIIIASYIGVRTNIGGAPLHVRDKFMASNRLGITGFFSQMYRDRPELGDHTDIRAGETIDDDQTYLELIDQALTYIRMERRRIIKKYKKIMTANARTKDELEELKMKQIASRTMYGMFACWLAQWVWWIGYVRVSAENYCPPKLGIVTMIWTIFSALGIFLGGGV